MKWTRPPLFKIFSSALRRHFLSYLESDHCKEANPETERL
jgi:hypothetical protein